MGTVGIVVLSLLAGLFLAILIAAVVFLIWVNYQLRAYIAKTRTELGQMITKLHSAAVTFESNLQLTLKQHADAFSTTMARLDGEALMAASKANVSAAARIEKACVAFGELTLSLLA